MESRGDVHPSPPGIIHVPNSQRYVIATISGRGKSHDDTSREEGNLDFSVVREMNDDVAIVLTASGREQIAMTTGRDKCEMLAVRSEILVH